MTPPTTPPEQPVTGETQPEVFYFGCVGQVGHHLHSKKRSGLRGNETPWEWSIDAGIFKSANYGVLYTAKKDGWTLIFVWDNSVDSRPGSHSTFVAHQDMTTDELLNCAREQWPEIFSRRKFPHFTIDASTPPSHEPKTN